MRETTAPGLSSNRQFATVLTLAAYCGVILVGATHHEPWADEAQAWLLSRDLGYRYLIFHQLAYDGHPPLWPSILWIATHWFHLPYQAMGWIGGLCALAGCWFFCRYSPFPLLVRILFPFTYFMAYQYAIVARPYVLLPLCMFAAAHSFADADRRPWRFVGAISALSLVTAAGVTTAIGLMMARSWYIFRSWRDIPAQTRRTLIVAAIAFALVLVLIALVNWPPADRSQVRPQRSAGEATVGLRFLPRDLSAAFLGSPVPSIALLVVVGAWCACRRRLLPFVIPTALTLAFFVKVYANLWHCGALTLIVVAAAWIAWQSPGVYPRKLHLALNALLVIALTGLFAVQIYWSARTLVMDYSRSYSGSLDAANFLREVGADAGSTCGIGFHTVALQPYFRESIYGNWPQGESFWRFDLANRNDQSCHEAKWVVIAVCCNFDSSRGRFLENDRRLRSYGYVRLHSSEGSLFFEGRETEPTDFFIYERPD